MFCQVVLYFIDEDDPTAAPKEERCYAVQFGNEHVVLHLDSQVTKAVGDSAEYQRVSVQLPLVHLPQLH